MAPVTPPLMPMMPSPSTYKVGGPSTLAAEGQSFTLLAPGFPVPPPVIEDLYPYGEIGLRVSAIEGQVQVGVLDGSSYRELHAADRRIQIVISEMLKVDHRRSTEIIGLRTALQGQ
nr:hypothetical protein [Tanacetum cinerariifolium]